ncbi:MAG: tetratricopeptide repeat protein [Ignavibacteriales bacterium]
MEQPQVEKVLDNAQEALKNNDVSHALQYFLQAAEIIPEDVAIINQVASCYYTLGEFDRAQACWNLALVTDPDDQKALQSMEKFNDMPFQFWLKRYREAVTELENRNYQRAGDMLSDLVGENDGFVALYQLLGLCLFAESDIEGAKRVWSRGLTLDNSNPVLLRYLANHCEEPGDMTVQPAEAVKGKQLLRSASWAIVASLGLFLLVQIGAGFYSHGKAVTPSQADPASRPLQQSAAANGAKETRPSQLRSFEEASSQGDQYETGREMEYYQKGYAAYYEGDWSTACSNLGVVVSMDSGSYIAREALYFLAQSYYFRKDYGQAREYFEKYLKAYPKSAYADDSLYYLACAAITENDMNAARDAFSKLGEIAPRSGYFTSKEYRKLMQHN